MSYDVGIKITAESQLEGIKQAEAEVQRLGQTAGQVGAAAGTAAAGLDPLEKGLHAAYLEARPLRMGLSEVISQLGLTGAGAHVAAYSVLNMEEGFTRMTAAAVGGGVGLSMLVAAIKDVGEERKKIDASFDPGKIAETTKSIELQKGEISDLGTLWGHLAHPVEAYMEDLGAIFGFQTAQTQSLEAQEMGANRARLDLLSKVEMKIKDQAALVGLGMPEAINEENRQAKIAFTDQVKGWGLTHDQIVEVEKEFDALAARKLGDLGLKEFIAEARSVGPAMKGILGLDPGLLSGSMETAFVAADAQIEKFSRQFYSLLDPKNFSAGALGDLQLVAKNYVDQLVQQMGYVTPALQSKINSLFKNLSDEAKLKGIELPLDISAAQDKLNAVNDQIWRLEMKAAGVRLGLDDSDFTDELGRAQQKLEKLKQDAAHVSLGGGGIPAGYTAQALKDFGNVAGITREAAITFGINAKGSPTMPFSDYFGNYAVGVVNNFVQQASQTPVTLATDFTQALFKVQSQIIDAEGTLAQYNAAMLTGGGDFVGDLTAGTRRKLEGLKEAKGEILALGRQQGGGSGGGGGGGGTTQITIDMRDALITGDVITSNLLPTLRDLIRQTTGKDPGMRTLS